VILLVALLLREVNVNHTLSWDEASNVFATMEQAGPGPVQPLFWPDRFYQHPPVYLGTGLVFEKVTHADRRQLALFLQFLSILSSLAVVFLIYLCGKDWFNEKVGLFAAFFYAILPAARVFDTWIKQNPTMMAFALAFLLFFFRKKWLIAGLFLGLALLTEELAIFVVLAVGVYLLVSKRFKDIKVLLLASAVAAVTSFWWFVFFSKSTHSFIDFFLGSSEEAKEFANRWYHFLTRIPQDIGWITFAVCIAAVVMFVVKRKEDKRGMVPFLLVWIVLLYLIFSISYGKAPWLIQTVLPPLALLAGWGLYQLATQIPERRVAFASVALVLAVALSFSITGSFDNYMQKSASGFSWWQADRDSATYINQNKGQRVMMRVDDFDPVLAYYINSVSPDSVTYLLANAPAGATSDSSLFLVDPATSFDLFRQRISAAAPDYLIIMSVKMGTTNSSEISLIDGFKRYATPVQFGRNVVFNGLKISQRIAAEKQAGAPSAAPGPSP